MSTRITQHGVPHTLQMWATSFTKVFALRMRRIAARVPTSKSTAAEFALNTTLSLTHCGTACMHADLCYVARCSISACPWMLQLLVRSCSIPQPVQQQPQLLQTSVLRLLCWIDLLLVQQPAT